jgi:hypothetical protein
MKTIRIGDTVYYLYHMSNRGIVTEVYSKPVRHGNGAGPFSRIRRVKFISELDGKEYDFKIEDIVRDN